MRVYGSDAFAPLVAFWRQALAQPQRLADRVAAYHPLSKPDFYALQVSLAGLADPLEQAAAFFVLNRASFSGTTLSGGMSPGHGRFNPAAIGRLRASRPGAPLDYLGIGNYRGRRCACSYCLSIPVSTLARCWDFSRISGSSSLTELINTVSLKALIFSMECNRFSR